MFYLQHMIRIDDFICTVVQLPSDAADRRNCIRKVYEAQTLLGYLYCTPATSGGTFLPFESSSIFLFTEGEFFPKSKNVSAFLVWHGADHGDRVTSLLDQHIEVDNEVPGFRVVRNSTVTFWVAEGSCIYPELPHLTLNHSQDVASNLAMFFSHEHNWGFKRLFYTDRDLLKHGDAQQRIFVSLEWYLRSCRTGISESESIVDFAIALESLVRVRAGEGLTERFKDAILTLVGPVPRLDSWLEQFYTARSKAVHEGVPHEVMFYAVNKEELKKISKEKKSEFRHRSLLEYGRRIFRVCLSNVIASASQAEKTRFAELFVREEEWLVEACRCLSQPNMANESKLSSAFSYLNELQDTLTFSDVSMPSLDKLMATGRRLLKLIAIAYTDLPQETLTALEVAAAQTALPFYEMLIHFERCAELLVRESQHSPVTTRTQNIAFSVSFLNYATSSRLKYFAYVTDKMAKDNNS